MSEPIIIIAVPQDVERRLLHYVLTHEGYICFEVGTPAETLDLAEHEGIDLIVLDRSLWRDSTTNALAALKELPATRDIPILLYGQAASEAELKEGLDAGAQEWIQRQGFEIGHLLRRLERVLRSARSAKKPPTNAAPAAPAPCKEESGPELPAITRESFVGRLGTLDRLSTFEFSITEAVTTTCAKDQVVDHIAGLCLRDPILTLGMLHLSNNLPGTAESHTVWEPRQAAHVTGSAGFYRLAETVQPWASPPEGWDAGHFWVHSVATGRTAAYLAKHLRVGAPLAAAATGLLHNVGYALLAQAYPEHLQALLEAARGCESPTTGWEKRQIGVHHGELAAWLFEGLRIPGLFADVASLHHASVTLRQPLKSSSRIAALLVQAADELVSALYPADVPLIPLAPVPDEFRLAVDHAGLQEEAIFSTVRKYIAELVSEMVHLIPSSTRKLYFSSNRPLSQVVYIVPRPIKLDIIREFLTNRADKVIASNQPDEIAQYVDVPAVINLTDVPEITAQVEVLTSFMALGVMKDRRGVILLPSEIDGVHRTFASETWRPLPSPCHPVTWINWLGQTALAKPSETSPAPAECHASAPSAALVAG
jgi:DNA-binding response OmpR family regulator